MTPEQIKEARGIIAAADPQGDGWLYSPALKGWSEALDEIERLNYELAEVKKWLQDQAVLLEELRK